MLEPYNDTLHAVRTGAVYVPNYIGEQTMSYFLVKTRDVVDDISSTEASRTNPLVIAPRGGGIQVGHRIFYEPWGLLIGAVAVVAVALAGLYDLMPPRAWALAHALASLLLLVPPMLQSQGYILVKGRGRILKGKTRAFPDA
jgi:hypothetical protein